MPDLFKGDPVPESLLTTGFGNFDLMAWVGKHGPDVTDPIIDGVLKEMRGSMGCKKVGAVGYCFGGFVIPPCTASKTYTRFPLMAAVNF